MIKNIPIVCIVYEDDKLIIVRAVYTMYSTGYNIISTTGRTFQIIMATIFTSWLRLQQLFQRYNIYIFDQFSILNAISQTIFIRMFSVEKKKERT